MEDGKKIADTVKANNAKRAAAAKKREERNKDIAHIKNLWEAASEGELVADLNDKIDGFILMHTKMARDGVAVRAAGKDSNGETAYENVFLTSEQRVAHLDQAKGLQELAEYVKRQTTIQTTKTK